MRPDNRAFPDSEWSRGGRGGKRKGAGRPKGSGTGRTVTTSSINLPPELWEKLDQLRGDQSRSSWIADRIKKARG